jgi:hypothetical protein
MTTKTTTVQPYAGENPFAANGIVLTQVTDRYSNGTVAVRVEAHRYGVLIAHASHPALLWDDVRKELGR